MLQPQHLLHDPVCPLHQPREDQHIKNELSNVLPRHRNSGQAGVYRRAAAGEERGVDQAGQDDDRPLHAHADIAFEKRLAAGGGALPGEGCQGQRCQGREHIEPEEPAIHRQQQDKGHDRDEQAAQQRDQP